MLQVKIKRTNNLQEKSKFQGLRNFTRAYRTLFVILYIGARLLPKMASTLLGTPLCGTILGFLSRLIDTNPGRCIWKN